MNDAMELLRIFETWLGSCRERCDQDGRVLWDRIQAAKNAQIDACLWSAELEDALMQVMNGERRANKIPMEPMVRLIAYARTGSTKNASIGGNRA
jgi:hypothetical protein